MNRVILIGNLGKDPEVRHFESGGKLVRFTLATNENATRNGERIKITEWHDIEVWDKLGDIAEKYLRKGSKVMIEGKIKTDSYKDKTGQDRQRKVIRAQNLELLDRSEGGVERTNQQEHQNEPENTPMSQGPEDDLPF